jgi:hypothetical protein
MIWFPWLALYCKHVQYQYYNPRIQFHPFYLYKNGYRLSLRPIEHIQDDEYNRNDEYHSSDDACGDDYIDMRVESGSHPFNHDAGESPH